MYFPKFVEIAGGGGAFLSAVHSTMRKNKRFLKGLFPAMQPAAGSPLSAPLKIRSFRLLFSAQVFSDLGNWMEFFAYTTLLTFVWEAGPHALAAFFVALTLPYMLFGSALGVLADRLDKRTVMIVCDLLRMLLMIGLFFMDSLTGLLVLLFVKGTLSTLFNSAKQGAIRLTVEEELLLPANSLSQTSSNLSKVLGPTVGALLLTVIAVQEIFLLTAGVYLLSALFLIQLPKKTLLSRPADSEKKSFLTEYREGWQVIANSKALKAIVLYFILQCLAMYAFETQGSLLVQAVGYEEDMFAYFTSIMGVGSFLCAFIAAELVKARNPFHMLFFAALLLGGLLILLSLGGLGVLPVTISVWLVIWFLMGAAITVMGVCYGYLLQTQTPPSHMGRVSGTAEAFVYGAILLGSLGSGFVADLLGVAHNYLWAGVLMVAAGVFALACAKHLKKGHVTKESTVSH